MNDRKLILVSKSPRRRQLLAEAGFDFEVKSLEVDESFPAELPVAEVAEYIARKKAATARHLLEEGQILLTADTVVLLDGKIYEKPKDQEDAVRILEELSGRVHQVITGVCLLDHRMEQSFSGHSLVHFSDLSREEIEYYIEKCQPFDKAGAYGVQEWIGHCKIKKIEGTYANIMGLPVNLVYEKLQAFDKI